MDLSPQVIANSTFPVVRRGYDPDDVRAFLAEVAQAYDGVLRHSSSMEARARAAVAKVHELQNSAASDSGISRDDAETISRTLLLAQKAADTTIAEARAEAEALLAAAQADSRRLIADAQAEVERELASARADARRQVEAERLAAESEVQALLARRDFLVSDVDALEHHLADRRRRLREIADLLVQVAEQSPGGLGEVRRPVLSAAGDVPPAGDEGSPVVGVELSTDDLWSETDAEDDDVFGPDTFSGDSLGADTLGADTFSEDTFGADNFGADTVSASDPFGADPFAAEPAPPEGGSRGVDVDAAETDGSGFAAPRPDVARPPVSEPVLDPTPHESPALLDFDRLPRRQGRSDGS